MMKQALIAFVVGVIHLLSAVEISQPIHAIEDHLKAFHSRVGDKGLCDSYNCCVVGNDEKCLLDKFQKDQSYLILPGGETRCMFSYSTPFAFQIIPGDSDNLLFYFQGGGACWDQATTNDASKYCATNVSPQPLTGVFDRKNIQNRFRSYTIVHVMYCSGDIHGGNTIRTYPDTAGQPVVQVGVKNVRSAIDWVKEQITLGYLANTFSNFVIMGCSAGSIGSQIWSHELLSQFQWKQAAIVPDSYAGLLPEDTFGQMMFDYGFCSSGLLSSNLLSKCLNKIISLKDLNLEFMSNHPNVPYTFIQSKVDSVQIGYYMLLAQSYNTSQQVISQTQFYTELNNFFGEYNNERKNFLTYLINGDHHCFTQSGAYYTADTKGPADRGLLAKAPILSEWTNQLPLTKGKNIHSECEGTFQEKENTYCSSKVILKEFVQE